MRDGLSAQLADPEGAGLQPLDRSLDLRQVTSDLQDERSDLRPLERDGRALGVVLVVGVAVAGRLHHLVEVVGQARQPAQRLLPLRLEVRLVQVNKVGPEAFNRGSDTVSLDIRTACLREAANDEGGLRLGHATVDIARMCDIEDLVIGDDTAPFKHHRRLAF